MRIIVLSIVSLFISSHLFAASHFRIIDKGKQEITIPGYTVIAGGYNSSFVVVANIIKSNSRDVAGIVDIGGDYGRYKSHLPVTSGYGNSNSFTVRIAFSENDKEIICISESWNQSSEIQAWNDLTFNLEWYLLK